jgi:hypothetical protein
MLHAIPDEIEIHRSINLPQQVLLRHKRIDTSSNSRCCNSGFFSMNPKYKDPVENESLSWYSVSSLTNIRGFTPRMFAQSIRI